MKTTLIVLLTTLGFFPRVSHQEVQTPERFSVEAGQSVTFRCVADSGIDYDMSWYQLKPGAAPKLLIYESSNRNSGVPGRFSGTNSGYTFTFSISGVRPEDAGEYYCMGYYKFSRVFVFGGGTKLSVGRVTRPSLSLLPPSSKELQQGKATLLCLVSKGFPSDWTLSWKVDGSRWSSGVVVSPGVLQRVNGLYSWSSTLTLTEDQWRKMRVVSCEVSYGSDSVVTKSLNTQQCIET